MFSGRVVLFYPIVFAALPSIFLFAGNKGEGIPLSEVLVPLAIVIAVTVLMTFSLKQIIKDNAKAALIVSILLAAFFFYGHVHIFILESSGIDRTLGRSPGDGFFIAGFDLSRQRFLLLLAAVVALGGVSLTLRFRGNLLPLVQGITAGALFAVSLNAFSFVYPGSGSYVEGQPIGEVAPGPGGAGQLPDIYYIILDAYARADVLEEIHDFDNSEFIDFLAQKGFYVVPESRSNYIFTKASLASSLNMRYHTEKEDHRSLVEDNIVVGLLKSLGYRYVHLDSAVGITRKNKHADVAIRYRRSVLFSEFTAKLFELTLAAPVADKLGLNWSQPFAADFPGIYRANLEYVGSVPNIPGPTFTFNHNLPPHDPFVFDRDGNSLEDTKFTFAPSSRPYNELYSRLYIEQLIYVNKSIGALVEDLLERSPQEPVIVIQGDHGTGWAGSTEVADLPDRFMFEKAGILNAIYLPGYCRKGLYPTMTPVNTFRIVFNSCLGADLDLLEDRTYYSIDDPELRFFLVER